ncbi:Spermidine N(1)-acetyltransferase [Frondihabitans sp. 762G35]|uniref:GNAT family N-acetyltransferase n=1 Tax=Frondihabitans sp. 762G35 TaxID=1446794 RepID=UPI000D204F48|nr:GNAT family N-acetyltransferase [Frondihabitans sp. 762G35]ARC55561.1 Spermidine N(1)-acetyltransferase [Frondihabitans sp. 762G35]
MLVEASAILTERLLLRPLTIDDLDDVLVYQSDPEVLRYMLWPARDRAAAREHLERRVDLVRLAHDGDGLVLAVETQESPGCVIGEVNVSLTSVADRQAEVGWIVAPEFQGRGYAFEAASRILQLCFEDLGSHRVHARLDPRNAASVALCRRLGMREEAHFVEDLFFKGEWADTGVYAILEAEWRARLGDAHGAAGQPTDSASR